MNGHVEVGKEPADMKVEYQRATIGTLKGIKKEEQKMKKILKKQIRLYFVVEHFVDVHRMVINQKD